MANSQEILITDIEKEEVKSNSPSNKLPLNPTAQGFSGQQVRRILSQYGDEILNILITKLSKVKENIDLVSNDIDVVRNQQLRIVPELPSASFELMNILFFVPSSTEGDTLDEYVVVENEGVYSWSKVGDTSFDLSQLVPMLEQSVHVGDEPPVSSSVVFWIDTNE